MKILLDIEDNKASALLEVLNGLSFVKTQSLKNAKKQTVLKGVKEAVKEVRQAKEGKIKLKTFDDFLDEL